MAGGWYAIWRKLLESELWLSEKFTRGQAWVDIVGLARFNPGTLKIKGVEHDLERGELAHSELFLAKRFRWSRGKVRRYLNELKTEQRIVQRKSNVTTVITILNYDQYQTLDTANGTANGTPDSTAEQKEKKEKKVDKEKKEEKENYNKENKKGKKCPEIVPAILDNEKGRKAVVEWLAYRKGFTALGIKKLLTRMAKRSESHGIDTVIAAMDGAMANGNQGWDYDGQFRGTTLRPATGDTHKRTDSLFAG